MIRARLPLDVPQGADPGFVRHTHETVFAVAHDLERVWAWLTDPATFVDHQTWPYRVEFVDGGFEPGVLALHYGPLMNFAGVLGEIRQGQYRDLQYFYGSYAFSLRLIRPTRLQFWTRAVGEGATEVKLQVDSFVRPWLAMPWDRLQRVFWGRFGRWMDSALSG